MNVASRDLCIELKNLSNWGETDFCWNGDHLTPAYWPEDMRTKDLDSNPAYDLGYLVRKIRKHVLINELGLICRKPNPEDRAAQIAIKLWKNGVFNESDEQ